MLILLLEGSFSSVCSRELPLNAVCLESCEFTCQLCILGHRPLVVLEERLIFANHALLALKILVEFLELLRQEERLVSNDWINRCQGLKNKN